MPSLISSLIQRRRDGEIIAARLKHNIRKIERELKQSRAVLEQYHLDGNLDPVKSSISALLAEVQILLNNNVEMEVFVNNTVAELQQIVNENEESDAASGSG